VDAWQFTIADVGPSGLDKGKASKYIFTPPGYKEPVPEGYIHVASPNYRIALAFRSIVAPGKTQKDAFNYAQKLRLYYLSEADNPPEQKFVNPINDRYATLPFYDERHFEDIYNIVSVEPVRPIDKHMMGLLASIGIEKGKPFEPDEITTKAMRQAAIDAWYHLQDGFDKLPDDRRYWPDRHYYSLLMADDNKRFTFEYDESIDIDFRALQYFWATYVPKVATDTPPTEYVAALADADGSLLEAGKIYKVDIPAEVPVKQFWALTCYDRATFGFIYTDSNRTTLSSYDLDKLKKNLNGSVTIYIGPEVPEGLESNWIPTAGKRPMPTLRMYGPTEELFNRTFKLPDFELVE